uniref:Putative nucleotidyltransferase n=1 Tax=viral metagenome TaxID=1070528 RepID=A0A6M3LW66_9ZZZZ
MKAIVLCAGLGTRMRPLTDHTPKCLLPVGGKPLLHHTLERLAEAGVTDVAINLHHLPACITNDIKRGWQFGLRVTYSYEPELLGTAGAIKRLAWWLDDEPFFVVYGDEWTTLNLSAPWTEHMLARCRFKSMATAVAHETPSGYGRNVIEFTENNNMVRLWPKEILRVEFANWATSGIYIVEPDLVGMIAPFHHDLEDDVLPLLASLLHVYCVDVPIIDIGKPEGYERANRLAGPSW